jgi:hypothetical protein
MSEVAAQDACVHEIMLDHEAAHTQAFDAAVDTFIDEKRSDFEAAMKALKQTPSPSSEMAKTRWNKGVRQLVEEAKRQLLADIRAVSATVDDADTLRGLEEACDGRWRDLKRLNPARP